MKYKELAPSERRGARVLLLNALNSMEREQAADAGKAPEPYKMTDPLFKQMLPEMEFERFFDEDGQKYVRLI